MAGDYDHTWYAKAMGWIPDGRCACCCHQAKYFTTFDEKHATSQPLNGEADKQTNPTVTTDDG